MTYAEGDVRDRSATADALRALDLELANRRAELASLERARDILARSDDERCDAYHPDKPCDGIIRARFCIECGLVTKRCDTHGGIRAAAHVADLHRTEAHAGSDAGDPPPADTRRVPERSAPVPVGRVQAPPPPRGARTQARIEARPPYIPRPQQPQPRATLSTSSPAVIRRTRRGHTMG